LILSGSWHICSTAGEQPTGQPGLTSKAEDEGKGKGKTSLNCLHHFYICQCRPSATKTISPNILMKKSTNQNYSCKASSLICLIIKQATKTANNL